MGGVWVVCVSTCKTGAVGSEVVVVVVVCVCVCKGESGGVNRRGAGGGWGGIDECVRGGGGCGGCVRGVEEGEQDMTMPTVTNLVGRGHPGVSVKHPPGVSEVETQNVVVTASACA